MALQTININELKYRGDKLIKLKDEYDETLDNLMDSVRLIVLYWQGEESRNYRNELYNLIGLDLKNISNEMDAEIEYLKKLVIVLENAQEQIRNRLNS